MYLKNCKKCNSENIIYVEYLGAYDGALEIRCSTCGHKIHRSSEKEITDSFAVEEYSDIYFLLNGEEPYKNRYPITKEEYDEANGKRLTA